MTSDIHMIKILIEEEDAYRRKRVVLKLA